MIIRENKLIDQFLTPKHQQIWLPFWKLLAFNRDFKIQRRDGNENVA